MQADIYWSNRNTKSIVLEKISLNSRLETRIIKEETESIYIYAKSSSLYLARLLARSSLLKYEISIFGASTFGKGFTCFVPSNVLSRR